MLNANHKSSLQVTFHTIDEALSRAMTLLDSSREQSAFSEEVRDTTLAQWQTVADYVARIRAAMQSVLAFYGIPQTQTQRSSLWAARTAILSADIMLDEIHPRRLRGYGAISADDAQELIDQTASIAELLDQLQASLAPPVDGHEEMSRSAGKHNL